MHFIECIYTPPAMTHMYKRDLAQFHDTGKSPSHVRQIYFKLPLEMGNCARTTVGGNG